MKISDVMTRDPQTISPGDTLRSAAQTMDDLDVGALPVCDGQRLVGVITDRDIVVRSAAAGQDPQSATVSQAMTDEVRWVYEDDDVSDAEKLMRDIQIRRVPVVNRDKKLVGIVSLGDLATDEAKGTEKTLERVSEPSMPDR